MNASYNIRKFLLLFLLGISLGIYAVFLIFLYYNNSRYEAEFNDNLKRSLEESSEKISRNMVSMCNLTYSTTCANADKYLGKLQAKFNAFGAISVVNEDGDDYAYLEHGFESNPILKFGKLEIRDSDEIIDLIEEVKVNAICDFAVYLRINANSDLVNVISTATHIEDVYTPENAIFRVGEDGKDSRVLNALLLGESVDEVVILANTYIYVRYIPIMATNANLSTRFVGALACYIEDDNLNRIYTLYKDRKINKSGFYWIMEDLQNGDYRYKLSMGSQYDGILLSENESNQRERDYVANLTLNAKFLRSGECRTDFIDLKNDDTALVSYLYFEPWNWILGTLVYKSEMENFSQKAPSFMQLSFRELFLPALFALLFSIIASYYFAKPIANFFEYLKRNFSNNRIDSDEKFKTFIIDFKLFIINLSEAGERVDSFLDHIDNSNGQIGEIYSNLKKNEAEVDVLSQTQYSASSDSYSLISSMYSLSEKLSEFSENYKLDAKNTLTFTRQKAQSLKALRKESELLKDIGGGFSSRFLRIRNVIENLSVQLEELRTYADKTKKLGENMESEIKLTQGAKNTVFASLIEDTNSFYGETALSILTMKNFLSQMRESIDSTISEMRDFLNLMGNGILEIDDILEKLETIIEQIVTQQSRFQEMSRGAIMQSESILQVLKIVSDLKRYAESTKNQVTEFDSILDNLEELHRKLN